ncbi:hypothetical protein TSUD_79480 [Trifolium subterraneum]|uniref:Uncharacterized protein n=1 Tax=Trifolium subterraneum TaxID=3900 RepID=A0A2Z6MSA9_TRISU|nr:hypothetical protein TSUD_79480 [Trifolium subterraneum]
MQKPSNSNNCIFNPWIVNVFNKVRRYESVWHLFMSCPDLISLWKQHGYWESVVFVLLDAAGFTDSSNLQQLYCIFSAVTDVIRCGVSGIVKICIYVKELRTSPWLVTGLHLSAAVACSKS